MAVYNGERYLAAAVESILCQTFPHFEFLVIDDGSQDATPALLADFAQRDPRIRLISHAQNRGLTACLHEGVSLARGAYIARQDADDLSLPQRLQQQVGYLDAHPETVLVSCNLEMIDATGRVIDSLRRDVPPMEIRWYMQFYNHLGGHGQVMFRRDAVLAAGNYDRQYRYSQDYALWLRLLQVGEIHILPEVLFQWRTHSTNISHQQFDEQERLSITASQQQLATLLPALPPLETVAALRAFWMGAFPPVVRADLMSRQLQAVAGHFADAQSLAPPERRRLHQIVAQQFILWSRSIPLRRQPRHKGQLWALAAHWHPPTLLQEWFTQLGVIMRRTR